MKNKILKNIGTLVLGAGLSLNSFGQNADKEIPCLSSKEVEFIVSEIPKYFNPKYKESLDQSTYLTEYLIEYIPEAKKDDNLGGELSVYLSRNGDSIISIFDRTSLNPSEWYNVSNWIAKKNGQGCADFGIYLKINPIKHLSKSDSQKKFNEFVYKVKKMIKEK